MLSVVQPAAIQVMYSSLVLCQTQLNGSATQSCCLSVCAEKKLNAVDFSAALFIFLKIKVLKSQSICSLSPDTLS